MAAQRCPLKPSHFHSFPGAPRAAVAAPPHLSPSGRLLYWVGYSTNVSYIEIVRHEKFGRGHCSLGGRSRVRKRKRRQVQPGHVNPPGPLRSAARSGSTVRPTTESRAAVSPLYAIPRCRGRLAWSASETGTTTPRQRPDQFLAWSDAARSSTRGRGSGGSALPPRCRSSRRRRSLIAH